MRFQFIGLLASLLFLNLYFLVFYNYWFSFLINITASLGIVVFTLNIFSILFSYKINKRVIYFSLVLYFIALFLLLFKWYTDKELKEEDYAPFVYSKHQIVNTIKGIIHIQFVILMYHYCIVILKKISSEFYYHRVLKKWIYLFLIIATFCIIIIVLNLSNYFHTINTFINNKIKFGIWVQEFIYCFVLFRPDFLDAHELKYSISEIMDLSQKKGLSKLINNHFYKEKYYLNPDASLSRFSQLTKIANDEINDFVILKYHQNFMDLINIHRIQHFILLIDQGKHKELTIEHLGSESGFPTRQALYHSFKKFKNCAPSDYISSLNI